MYFYINQYPQSYFCCMWHCTSIYFLNILRSQKFKYDKLQTLIKYDGIRKGKKNDQFNTVWGQKVIWSFSSQHQQADHIGA